MRKLPWGEKKEQSLFYNPAHNIAEKSTCNYMKMFFLIHWRLILIQISKQKNINSKLMVFRGKMHRKL